MSLVAFSTPAGSFTGTLNNFFKLPFPFLRGRVDSKGSCMQQIPAVNIMEDKNDYTIYIAVPGVRKEALQVHIEGSFLTVSARPEPRAENLKRECTHLEYDYSSFSRSIPLPEGVLTEKITAAYQNGELSLILPKTAVAEEPVIRHVIV